MKEIFGALAPIYGTIVTSLIAMVIGIPVSFGIAIFLTELCPQPLRRPIGIAIELLAGIPSIIYGLWGFFFLAPFLQTTIQPCADRLDRQGAGHRRAVRRRALRHRPADRRHHPRHHGAALHHLDHPRRVPDRADAAARKRLRHGHDHLGSGARRSSSPIRRVGLVGGIMLGLGRALGETMAVTFVIGNSHNISPSLLAPATTISATIANEFTEATGDLYTSSLIALGLILFVITFAVLARGQMAAGPHGREVRRRAMAATPAAAPATPSPWACAVAATVVGLFFLFAILVTLLYKGFTAISPRMFLEIDAAARATTAACSTPSSARSR